MISAIIDDRRLKVVREANKKIRTVIASELKRQSKDLYRELRTQVRAAIAFKRGNFVHRTGTLLKSMYELPIDVERHQWRVGVSIGKGVKYANTVIGNKDEVTTITPKKGTYLAVPLNERAWQMSHTNKNLQNTTLKRRGFKGGNVLLGFEHGHNYGDFVPMFVLKKLVTLEHKIDLKDVTKKLAPVFKNRLRQRVAEAYK